MIVFCHKLQRIAYVTTRLNELFCRLEYSIYKLEDVSQIIRKYIRGFSYSMLISVILEVSAVISARFDDWTHWKLPVFTTPPCHEYLETSTVKFTGGRWAINRYIRKA